MSQSLPPSSGVQPTLSPASMVPASATMVYCTIAPRFTTVPGMRME